MKGCGGAPGYGHFADPSLRSRIAPGGVFATQGAAGEEQQYHSLALGKMSAGGYLQSGSLPRRVTQQRLLLTSQPRHLFSDLVIRNVSLIKASPT